MGEVGGAPRTPPTFFPTNINKVESRRFGSQWPSSADADGQRNPARWRCPAGRCPGFRARRRSHQVAGPCCDRGAEFSSGCIPDLAGSVPPPCLRPKIFARPMCRQRSARPDRGGSRNVPRHRPPTGKTPPCSPTIPCHRHASSPPARGRPAHRRGGSHSRDR